MAITVSNRVTFARDNGSPGDSLKVIANFRRARSNNCLFASLFNPGRCLSLFPCAVFCIPGFIMIPVREHVPLKSWINLKSL